MKSQGYRRFRAAGRSVLLCDAFATNFCLDLHTRIMPAALYCQVACTVNGKRPGGLGAKRVIQHTSSPPWTTWELAFAYPASGQAVAPPEWNGASTPDGQNVTVTNLSWNGNVAVNRSINPELHKTWIASHPIPASFVVNGNLCNGATRMTPASLSFTRNPASVLATSTATPGLTPTPISSIATLITHGNPRLPHVALTFDDGPSMYTRQVLAVLQRYKVNATFFAIGQNIARFPASLQQNIAAGNAVGNHTFTHPHLTTLPFASIYRELNDAQHAILQATGTRPTLFRPPFGELNEDVLSAASQLGMTVVTWSAVANDWDNPQPSPDAIAARILGAAGNGAIFLLHEGGGNRANTVAALPTIIEGLQARGLRMVTIPQMLADLNT